MSYLIHLAHILSLHKGATYKYMMQNTYSKQDKTTYIHTYISLSIGKTQ